MFLLLRPQTDSGSHTPQGWWPILEDQCNGNGQKAESVPRLTGGGLQGLLKKLNTRFQPSKTRKKCKRKLKLKGKKRRYTTSKNTDTSSTESSEYSTDSSVFSSSDEDCWEGGPPLTPSQEMNWTQFINRLCSREPVDPQLSPNKH
uniref:ORF3 n=1 Tax=Rodent Torque teno virus 1 TaxID=1514664 RepID=X2G8D6_9VIRU|nr:ORF3 [Rodent Torque teno virus 1]